MGSNNSRLRGDWIQTYSGRAFYPLAPYPQDVCIEDIAHALSQLCRFGGHCRRFYSVAEHSVLLSRVVVPEFQLWALLHDASEAYLVDVPRPIKKQLPAYVEAERRVMAAICARFETRSARAVGGAMGGERRRHAHSRRRSAAADGAAADAARGAAVTICCCAR